MSFFSLNYHLVQHVDVDCITNTLYMYPLVRKARLKNLLVQEKRPESQIVLRIAKNKESPKK